MCANKLGEQENVKYIARGVWGKHTKPKNKHTLNTQPYSTLPHVCKPYV
jgi:hypothetical protein